MRSRQSLPTLWMMTDERVGARLIDVVTSLPDGAGMVFRHYSLSPRDRRGLFDQVRRIARRKNILVMLGGPPALAQSWGADGSHGLCFGRRSPPHLLRSSSVHDSTELHRAVGTGADFVFASPIFPTQSHPGTGTLGPVRLGLLVRQSPIPVIALGGMNPETARRLAGLPIYGWAGIDAFDQKRNEVPR